MNRSQTVGWGGMAIGVLIGILALQGCATTAAQCDPNKRDFFNNTRCLASGSYDERQRGLRSTLASEQRRNTAFRALLDGLQAEQAQASGTLKARQADYARVDAAWRDLKQSLDQERNASSALSQRVAQIDGELKARKGADGSAGVAKKQATRDDLARQVSLLEKELNAGLYE